MPTLANTILSALPLTKKKHTNEPTNVVSRSTQHPCGVLFN